MLFIGCDIFMIICLYLIKNAFIYIHTNKYIYIYIYINEIYQALTEKKYEKQYIKLWTKQNE